MAEMQNPAALNSVPTARPPFPLWRIILFSLGGGGATIIGTVTGLATYFYIPPETGQADFPQYLSNNTIHGLTIFGIITFFSSLLPIILGPFVASWSDRSKSRLGRRKVFMVVSFLPIAVLSYLIFTPPVAHVSTMNAWYLLAVMVLLNVLRSLGGVSNAIAPEFGTSSKSIMYFSTFGSVGWVIGYLVGSQVVFMIKDAFASSGMTTLDAFHTTAGLLIVIGLFISILQFAVIDEKKYGSGMQSSIKLLPAMKKAFSNKPYINYILANQVYLWGDSIFNGYLVFYVTVNYRLPEYMITVFGAVLIGISLCLYPLVNIISRRTGKKKIFLFALCIMTVCMMLFAFPGITSLDRQVVVWIIIGLVSVYSAISGIVPGAIINEIIREDCVRTGIPSEASFNAAGGIITAIPALLPGLFIPSILLLGKSPENHIGVTLLAVVSGACLLISGILIFFIYNEKKIVASLKEHGYQ